MKNKILLVVLAIFLVSTVSALTINIQVPASFSIGQQISFSYSITSDVNQQITFISHVLCPKSPVAFLQEQTITLQANIPYNDIYTDMIVNEQFEPQICTAYIQILSSIKEKFEKNFSIITDPSFSFNIVLDKKVYNFGENINLNYESDVENPVISAKLTYPDGTREEINLPKTIKASQIGTYEFSVTASKEGYKTVTKKEQFGVIERQLGERGFSIATVALCNADGICNNNEDNQNCPQDCPPTIGLAEIYNINNRLILYIILFSFIELILIVGIYLTYKSLKKSTWKKLN